MRRMLVAFGTLSITILCCGPVLPYTWELTEGQRIRAAWGWPAGVQDMMDGGRLVYGVWQDAGLTAFYAGDQDAFHEVVDHYSALRGTPRRLVLHAGGGSTARLGEEEKGIEFDWQLRVLRRGRHPDAPEDPTGYGSAFVVTLDLWLGGEYELEKLKVPLSIEVISGGEIEEFIEQHEARQAAPPPIP